MVDDLPDPYGGVLIGGGSRRMGRPKQSLRHGGRSWLGLVLQALAPFVERCFVLGQGELPGDVRGVGTLVDAPGAAGPLAGILGALRHAPQRAWLIAACDMPLITPQAVAWLLRQRTPQALAVIPRTGEGRPEPLLAVYEPGARPVLERLVCGGVMAPRELAVLPGVRTPTVPDELRDCWRSLNTPQQASQMGVSLGARRGILQAGDRACRRDDRRDG